MSWYAHFVSIAEGRDRAPAPPTPTERSRPPFTPALQTNLPPSPGPNTIDPSSLLSPSSITSYDTPLTPANRHRSPSPNTARPGLDLSLLLRPALYSPIPTTGIPPPFLHSAHQPTPGAPLEQLLEAGHFRHAAEKVGEILGSSGEISPFDIPRVLELFYVRLACLVLISHPEIAAKEARALLDILAREGGSFSQPGSRAASRERPVERINALAMIPWDLRLLLESLKTVLTNDSRRGVMNLYQLASECRAQAALAAKTSDTEARAMWGTRLSDLGIRVANELVSMGEYETAIRHLQTLEGRGDGLDEKEQITMAVRKALLYLRIGHVDAAAGCYTGLTSTESSRGVEMLRALNYMAETDYSSAVDTLNALHSAHPSDELVKHNLAVCLLYNGHVTRASEVLEDLVGGHGEEGTPGSVFPALLFNLATIYELRTEKAREKKVNLVEKVADRQSGSQNEGVLYERQGVDFKL